LVLEDALHVYRAENTPKEVTSDAPHILPPESLFTESAEGIAAYYWGNIDWAAVVSRRIRQDKFEFWQGRSVDHTLADAKFLLSEASECARAVEEVEARRAREMNGRALDSI
jgi:hypothetical protein